MYKFQDYHYNIGDKIIYLPDLHSYYENHGKRPRIYIYWGKYQSDSEVFATDPDEPKHRYGSLPKHRCIPYSDEAWEHANALYDYYEMHFDEFHNRLRKLKQGKFNEMWEV